MDDITIALFNFSKFVLIIFSIHENKILIWNRVSNDPVIHHERWTVKPSLHHQRELTENKGTCLPSENIWANTVS